MIKITKKYILAIVLVLLFYQQIQAAGKSVFVDSVKIQSGFLTVGFAVDGIIDQKTAEGLRKGLTSTIEYEIQLWEKKSGWLNNLIITQNVRMKVFFDNWENKFVIMSAEEKRLTSSMETVRKKCSQHSRIPVCPMTKVKQGNRYFITVKTILRPLSVENYQEIKNWLSGSNQNMSVKKDDNKKGEEKRAKGGVLKMVLALTGFGDKVISGKSNDFRIGENSVQWID